jgi:hypothetical protein
MRKDGFYKVVYKGELRTAKYITNQDHDSSWSCWWIEGKHLKLGVGLTMSLKKFLKGHGQVVEIYNFA